MNNMTNLTNDDVRRKIRNIIDRQFGYCHEEVLVICNRYLSAITKIDQLLSKLGAAEAQLAELGRQAQPVYQWRHIPKGGTSFTGWLDIAQKGDYDESSRSFAGRSDYEFRVLYSRPVPQAVSHPDAMLCDFYEVKSYPDLVRGLVLHVEQLQDSAKRNVKPWDDTFPETLLPAYIERIKNADAAVRAESQPVALRDERTGSGGISKLTGFNALPHGAPLYSAPQAVSQPYAVPVSGVTAEHQRVIEMLLKVCGAAFELADDTCEQEVDGEQCHVVPDASFQKLSDTLDEIENSLPIEDADRPDVFLAWAAMPRAALKSILQSGKAERAYPDKLPCDVLLVPGVKIGKGCPTRTLFLALNSRAASVAALEAMTPEERKEHDAAIEEFKGMLGISSANAPVSPDSSVPEGYCIMPLKLTAANGAKGALSGEFHITRDVTCHECGGEGCEDCSDRGSWEEEIPIGWDIIKLIYKAAVDSCSIAAALQYKESK